MQPLSNISALIIDMDGVLWEGLTPFSGLVEFFAILRAKNIPFILATNNATLTQEQYVLKLKKMGVTVSINEILTSSMATAHYLSEHNTPTSTHLFVIGEIGLRQALTDKGFILIDSHAYSESGVADFVVCGLDRQLSWKKLAEASLHLNAGATFIATNADSTLPTEHGLVVGNGSILAALETASEKKAQVIGKPEPIMYQLAIKILASTTEQTVAIGDRLNTDILGAVNTGIRSIMVLSGISNKEDLQAINYQPTWIMDDIQAITHALQID